MKSLPGKHQQEVRKINIKRLLFALRALTARHIDWNAVTPLLEEQCLKTHTTQAFQQFRTSSDTFNMQLTRNYLSTAIQHQYSPRDKIQKLFSVNKHFLFLLRLSTHIAKCWPTVQPSSFRIRTLMNPCPPKKTINTLYLASRLGHPRRQNLDRWQNSFMTKFTCKSIFSHLSWKRSWASREKDGDGILPSALQAADAAFLKETHSQQVNTVAWSSDKQIRSHHAIYFSLKQLSHPS